MSRATRERVLADRVYQKQRRDAARIRGECQVCCRRPVMLLDGKPRSRCAECDVRHVELEKRRAITSERTRPGERARSVEFCLECVAASFHRAACPAVSNG